MLNIPYGESDFKGMIQRDYFYQDRTQFIARLEQWNSKFPVFLRPRRFGKSLFITTMHHYYGLEHQQDFQLLFGKLYIGQHPTKQANTYMVLSMEFSRIDTATHESTYRGFLTNVVLAARSFLDAYKDFFSQENEHAILTQQSPEGVIKALFSVVRNFPHKIYVLIDEYDHFANELLSFDMARFKSDVSRNGFVRKFYETLKTATRDGVVDRIFITGVSPVTLDSLTSGFNISDNISLNPIFHNMMGFTHNEVVGMLHQSDIAPEKIPSMMSDLAAWYNGYLFGNRTKERLFNPDMVLYFLKEYSIMEQYPDVMLDTNVISDYRKVRNIFKIGGNETEKFELLETLVKVGHIDFPLTRLYNLEMEFSHDDFLSLLFYMGMLSFKEARLTDWRFQIPNYVIKKLYFEYFTSIFLTKTRFHNTRRPIGEAVESLFAKGNPVPFFKVVEHVLRENHSNRDELVYGEKHLQTLMIGLLFPYEAYYIHSEYEVKKGYPDIFLERMPDRMTTFDIVFELKYIKKSAAHTLPTVIAQVKKQLNEYMTSERFNRPDVRGYYMVFLGGEVYEWGEWKNSEL